MTNKGWNEIAYYSPPEAVAASYCGRFIEAHGNNVFLTCNLDKSDNMYAGSVYMYDVSSSGTVTQLRKLTGEGTPYEYFGRSLLWYNNMFYVGAQAGSVTLFDANNWNVLNRLKPPADTGSIKALYFGFALAVENNNVVVGAFGSIDSKGDDLAGAAFYYVQNGTEFTLKSQMQRSDPSYLNRVGIAVGISGSRVILGADMTNYQGVNITG